MYLKHHGIKGQKWGVKNGPPYPLTKTKSSKNTDDVESIYKSLPKDDKRKVMGQDNPPKTFYSKDDEAYRVKTFITTYKDIPVSTFGIWKEGDKDVALSLMTRSGKEYRGKGYASKTVKKGMEWIDKQNYDNVYWDVRNDNKASIALAKKNGFKLDKSAKNDGWSMYVKKRK